MFDVLAPLTKSDIVAIKQADDLVVHLNKGQATARLVKRKKYNDPNPFAEDKYHTLTAAVGMESQRGADAVESGAAKCFAMIGIYHSQKTDTSFMLKTLRVGDELKFTFFPDGHNNTNVSRAGLHADILYMTVYRKGRLLVKFEVTTAITPSNSARMCCGVPDSAHYTRAREEACA